MKAADNYENDRLNPGDAFDFYGVCELEKDGRRLAWIWTRGSVSGRTLHMAQLKGKGLANVALRSGSLIYCDRSLAETERERLRNEDPVMLAEQLRAAAAVTIKKNGKATGVFMAGSREERSFTEEELRNVQQLASYIEEQWRTEEKRREQGDDQASNR
ncbi:GAF domain-containing protein [Paenibacillus sp. NPDC058071]|uniref:GAF domain-containing protein n=1 Tax=Paenibacillus sp. NPDC058071 TaxID=3346326 RepID=UPI0036DA637C